MRCKKRFAALLLILLLAAPGTASAWQPYHTYYVSQGTGGAGTRVYGMQAVYAVSVTTALTGDRALKQPADLYIAADDHLFVADKGNNRIVELNRDGEWVRQIGDADGKGALKAPEGVFVRPNGDIYVADTGHQRIAVFDAGGTYVKEFVKPAGGMLPDSYYFTPVKVVVDGRGVMYIVSKGSYQGIARLSESGEFTGFFGGNKTSGSWMDRLKRTIFTKEQLAREELKRPPEIGNVTLEDDGFLLATTAGVTSGQVRKLSAAGTDRLQGVKTAQFTDSDQIADVDADDRNFFYMLDRRENKQDAMISIYSPGGARLFTFGRTMKEPQQRGVLSYPVSIGIDSAHRLWVLDSDRGFVQAFDRTAFGEAVLTAAADYYIGDYEKSEANWNKVQSLNETIGLTYLGLGEIARKQGRIADAMAYFKLSYDNEGYSEAYWTYRLQWIQHDFGYAAGGVVLVWLLYRFALRRAAGSLLDRLPAYMRRVISELRDAWQTMIHPFEGFYRIKSRKLSVVTLLSILVLFLAAKTASLYWTGFIFRPYNLNRIRLAPELLAFIAPFAAWVIANYLVSTVKDGEGRFRDVLQSSLFAVVPYIVLTGPIVLLSNMLVLEEGILVSSLTSVMWLWVGALFIISSQVIHNFDFVENLRNSAITVVAIGVLFLFAAVTSGLTYNVSDFLYQLYKEVAVVG